MKPIDYDRMDADLRQSELHRVTFFTSLDAFGVTLRDGRIGQGPTIRAAIENASHERKAA